ncbi:MAG: hypothetical protein HYR67_01300 [Bacteroidetes bacterium]|nr:hypothetical protein [Bacteroidota bacterium]
MSKRSKKIYYVPGMISLIMLLPFVYKFLSDKNLFRQLHSMEMTWTSKRSLQIDSISHPEFYSIMYPKGIFKRILKRKYFLVELNGDDNKDSQKLRLAEQRIKDLISSPDTTIGIHFKFTPQTKYRSFIQTLNILLKNNAKTYWTHEDDIWVITFAHKQIKEPPPIDHGIGYSEEYETMRMVEIEKKDNMKRKQNIISYLNEYSIQYSVISLVYFVLIIFTVRQSWLQNRSTQI